MYLLTGMLRPLLAVLSAGLLVLLGPAAAAFAHDSVTGTSPKDGQRLQSMPEAVEVSFTGVPISLGSQILVEDAEGKNWAGGDVEIVNNVARQAIDPDAPAGKYTVTWRVVSSDSHPIEGTFTFRAGTGAGADTTAVSTRSPAAPQSPAGSGQQPDAQATASGFPVLLVGIMAVVLVGLIAIIAVVARRRLNRGDDPS